MESEQEVRRGLAMFISHVELWPDGNPIAPEDQVFAFASYVWQVEVEEGNVSVLDGDWTPEDALTGGAGRPLAERVNASRVGQRWIRSGAPLARRQYWPEVVIGDCPSFG